MTTPPMPGLKLERRVSGSVEPSNNIISVFPGPLRHSAPRGFPLKFVLLASGLEGILVRAVIVNVLDDVRLLKSRTWG